MNRFRSPQILLGLLVLAATIPSAVRAQGTFFKTIGATQYSEAYAITNSGTGGANDAGSPVACGLYLYVLTVSGDTPFRQKGKVLVAR